VTTRTAAPVTIETRFRAMGSEAHIVLVDGTPDLLAAGRASVERLERHWSRFVDDSELSGLNRHAGAPVIVSPDTLELVERCILASDLTGGRFDPTVGPALAALGYDRDFRAVVRGVAPVRDQAEPVPGVAGIDVDRVMGAVTLPLGVTLDPGGIGKGFAADLTAAALVEAGAAGALVDVGGDLSATGCPPAAEGWAVTVPDPLAPERELLRLALPGGAVATSGRLERTWRTTTGRAHHLIDPRTGRPVATDVVAVTVVAGEAWWAEALTKSLFLSGPDGLSSIGDAHAVLITADGVRHATPGIEATLR